MKKILLIIVTLYLPLVSANPLHDAVKSIIDVADNDDYDEKVVQLAELIQSYRHGQRPADLGHEVPEAVPHVNRFNELDADGMTPFHIAVHENWLGIARMLAEHGSTNIDLRDCRGRSPLVTAIVAQNNDVVEYLMSIGADFNVADGIGRGALHFAVLTDNERIVRTVIAGMQAREGSDFNVTADGVNTALHLAAIQGNPAIVRLLLAAGADPTLVNHIGNSALVMATRSGNVEVTQILESVVRDGRVAKKRRVSEDAVVPDDDCWFDNDDGSAGGGFGLVPGSVI